MVLLLKRFSVSGRTGQRAAGSAADALALARDAMDTVLSVVALAALALIAGAIYLWRTGRRQKAGLMLAAAVVMIVNVLIWTVPGSDGSAPVDRVREVAR